MTSVITELIDENIQIDRVIITKGHLAIELRAYNVFEFVKNKLMLDYEFEPITLDASDFGVPQRRERFFYDRFLEEINFLEKYERIKPSKIQKVTIGEAIMDLCRVTPTFDVENTTIITTEHLNIENDYLDKMNRSNEVLNHITTESRSLSIQRFSVIKQGENFHSLDDSLKSNYSDPSRTQSSIYKRLKLDDISGTVTNVRKAMWIHPVADRAISIREAARLQSFPDSFKFYGTKDSQYQQVGNAVPPLLSKAIAEYVLKHIE